VSAQFYRDFFSQIFVLSGNKRLGKSYRALLGRGESISRPNDNTETNRIRKKDTSFAIARNLKHEGFKTKNKNLAKCYTRRLLTNVVHNALSDARCYRTTRRKRITTFAQSNDIYRARRSALTLAGVRAISKPRPTTADHGRPRPTAAAVGPYKPEKAVGKAANAFGRLAVLHSAARRQHTRRNFHGTPSSAANMFK